MEAEKIRSKLISMHLRNITFLFKNCVWVKIIYQLVLIWYFIFFLNLFITNLNFYLSLINFNESFVLKFNPIESELFRDIPESVFEAFRIIPNQSEKHFVSRLIKNGRKSIRLNPIQSKLGLIQIENLFWIHSD